MRQIKFFATVLNPVFKDQVPSLKITLFYFVIGVLWILFSDKLLFIIVDDRQLLLQIQSIKGFLFVVVTAFLLYFIINSSHEKIRKSMNHYRKVEDKLHHHVYFDSITNLPNRRNFIERLNYALTFVKRSEQMVAVLIFDVDQYKSINDSLGHVFGDTLLNEVAYRLREIISREDVVFRVGTDEFAVIIQDMSDITETAKIGQDIIDSLSRPFTVMKQEIFITTSIGISLCPSDGEDANALIRYAEAALNRANQIGRNNYQFYTSEMSTVIFERLTMENSLRKAIEREEFNNSDRRMGAT
jgi:diguanylate cyclase (GGDEF)-like protein